MLRRTAIALFVICGLVMTGCYNGGDIVNDFGDFGDLPAGQNDELWLFCRQGIVYDAFCAGFGENPCPEGWELVPITQLPATCCRDDTGNAFWADVDECGPDWMTVDDGCLNNQLLCN